MQHPGLTSPVHLTTLHHKPAPRRDLARSAKSRLCCIPHEEPHVNRSQRELRRTGMLADRGSPRCPTCNTILRFFIFSHARTTETCTCGYFAYMQRREMLTDA